MTFFWDDDDHFVIFWKSWTGDLQGFGIEKVSGLNHHLVVGFSFCFGGEPNTHNKGGEDAQIFWGCVCWKWGGSEMVMLKFSKLRDISTRD